MYVSLLHHSCVCCEYSIVDVFFGLRRFESSDSLCFPRATSSLLIGGRLARLPRVGQGWWQSRGSEQFTPLNIVLIGTSLIHHLTSSDVIDLCTVETAPASLRSLFS